MKRKEKVRLKSLTRILRIYFITSIICLSIALLICGILIAGNNTRSLSLGEDEARLALAQKEDELALRVNEQEYEFRPRLDERLDSLLRFAPPPFSALYWAAECLAEMLS